MEFGSGTLNGILATETFFVNGMEIPETLFIEITEEEGDVFEDVLFKTIINTLRAISTELSDFPFPT